MYVCLFVCLYVCMYVDVDVDDDDDDDVDVDVDDDDYVDDGDYTLHNRNDNEMNNVYVCVRV